MDRRISSLSLVIVLLIAGLNVSMFFGTNVEAMNYSGDTKLDKVDASFLGEAKNDNAGSKVSLAGDINGDGYTDMLVAATKNDMNGTDSGRVYLIYGGPSGWSQNISLNQSDVIFNGEANSDNAGTATTGVGDVNGDGYDDFLIASPYNDYAGNNYGRAYLFFGNSTSLPKYVNLSKADVKLNGGGGYFGDTAGEAGDFDSDGYDDFMISAPNKGTGGSVFLFFGRNNWNATMNSTEANITFLGEKSLDQIGNALAGGGDVNGDGYDDIIICSEQSDENAQQAGQAYLIFGRANVTKKSWRLNESDASFRGEAEADFAGGSVSLGDINGDGLTDILIGAYSNDAAGTSAGKAYLYLGNSTGWKMDMNLSDASYTFLGKNDFDTNSGFSLDMSMGGDFNGDGFNDIIIASYNWGSGGWFTGRVYVYKGKAAGWSKGMTVANAVATFTCWKNCRAGQSLSLDGDVNGDGYADLFLGGQYTDLSYAGAGAAFLVFLDTNKGPTAVSDLKAYSSGAYSTVITTTNEGKTIYVQLNGTDGNSSRIDMAVVNVSSSGGLPVPMQLTLIETGMNTGKYRGNFTVWDRTSEPKRWIKAHAGETITVQSVKDPTKKVDLSVLGAPRLWPVTDTKTTKEDEMYKTHYWSGGNPVTSWDFDTNASWLNWDSTNHNVSGTPDNSDIGKYWVKVRITDAGSQFDEHNFTLTVQNVAPKITTANVMTVQEDSVYSVTYNSDDDPSTTWSWKKNATWLNFNPSTRVLSGSPIEKDVGSFWVNITVDDGKGGKTATNFTLSVTNRAPSLDGSEITSIMEDVAYSSDYNSDDDPDTIYVIKSNSDFLDIGAGTGVLSGTPNNTDVGSWYVNLSSNDKHGGSTFRNFSVEVTNVAPMITTGDLTSVLEDTLYSNDYSSTDDPDTTWSLETNASCMSINSTSGAISWDPDNGNVGKSYVNVSVDDGHGGTDFHNFTLTVVNVGPVIQTADSLLAWEDTPYSVDYNSSDDNDSCASFIKWGLKTNASWLSIDPVLGVLSGTPTNLVVGSYWVNVSISDGNGGLGSSNFTLTVKNKAPSILTSNLLSVEEDSEYFLHYFSDDDGQGKVLWTVQTTATWLTMDPKDGILKGTPDNSLVGKYDVKVTVDDGNGGTDSRTFVLIVINTPPVISTAPVTGVTQDQEYLMDFNSTDDGLGIIYWTMPKGPSWLTMDQDSGVLKGTPGNKEVGQYNINVTVSDGNGGSDNKEYTLTVLNVDDPAMWTRVPSDTVLTKGELYTFDVDAIEPDIGTDPVYGISSVPSSSMTINVKTGVLTWTAQEYGRYNVTITFGKDQLIYHRYVIVVDSPPTIALVSPADGSTVSIINPTFQWSASDPDGDNVTSDLYYGTDNNGVGSQYSQYKMGIGLKDTFYVPTLLLQRGTTYYWTVVPNDGRIAGECTSGLWSFSISDNATENTPPRILSTPTLDAEVGKEWTYAPQASDDDPKDVVTLRLVTGPTGMVMSAGVLTWVPTDGQVGAHHVKLEATDGKGGVYQEFIVVVKKIGVINHPPVINTMDPISIKEGGTISIVFTAIDADNDTLKFEFVSAPTGSSLSESGQFVWDTRKGDAGEYDIRVRVTDGLAQNVTVLHISVKKVGTSGATSLASLLPFLLIAVVIMVIVVFFIASRRRKEQTSVVEPIDEKATKTKEWAHETKADTRTAEGKVNIVKESPKVKPTMNAKKKEPRAPPTEKVVKAEAVKSAETREASIKAVVAVDDLDDGEVPQKPQTDAPKASRPPEKHSYAVVDAVDIDDLEEEKTGK